MQTSESFRLSALLSISGGLQGAYTHNIRGKVFANAQTGNVVLMSQNLMSGEFGRGVYYLCPLVAFALGVFVTERIENRFKEHRGLHWRQMILLAEVIALTIVGFLPLVMVMYFLIALLEDCGYMARATVVLDPIFKKVGLSGKSVIPFIVGTGCAIPGVMAARTIRNERERNATAMLAPFMPCGAKLPVISLFVGAFFPGDGWVGTLMYFVGIILILLCALLVNKIAGHKNRKSFFIIELPEYKIPSFKRAFLSMCARGWSYIVKAGTIILLCNFIVHMMQTFSWSFQVVEEGADNSILATVANPFAYILIPIVGYHAWQLAAAAVTGFIAKENVVGTLAVCYAFAINDDLEVESGSEVVDAMYRLTKAAALAYMMFNLFSPPCFAAIGALNAEIKDEKWLWAGIALQLGVGYTLGYLVFTIGTLITDPGSLNIVPAICGGVAVAIMAGIAALLCIRSDKKLKAEYALSGKK